MQAEKWEGGILCLKCLLSYRHRAEVASDVTPTCTFRSFARSFLLVRAGIYFTKDERMAELRPSILKTKYLGRGPTLGI